MAISRGSIHHNIKENLIALFLSFFSKSSCEEASEKITFKTTKKIKTFFGSSEAVLFPYARTSLFALLKSLNIPKGSQILMTPFNIFPMIDVIKNLELRPTFIDINLKDFGPDYSKLEFLLSQRPYCFFLTYLFGYVPDIDYISTLCKKYDVILIEDISHNIGAKYKNKYLGTFGYASIYSSSLTKYVDSFCGSFVLTNNLVFGNDLRNFYKTLTKPSKIRIRETIIKTLFWNICLSNIPFNLFVYPILLFLKKIKSPIFSKITNPIALKNKKNILMKFYFEKITNIQCKYMIFYLNKLNKLLDKRSFKTKIVIDQINKIIPKGKIYNQNNFDISEEKIPTYWQFLLKVASTSESKEILFNEGIETGITKLPNLAESEKVYLENATILKENFIFIPIHTNLPSFKYEKIFKVLSSKNQI